MLILSFPGRTMITFTYRYKIKPTKQQIGQFEQYLDICRSVYNYAHAERKAWVESRKSLIDRCSIHSEYIIPADIPFPSYNIQAKALTSAGSNNWFKLQGKIAKFHEKVSNARRDWLFKLAHYLCDQTDNIFIEDINYKSSIINLGQEGYVESSL